MNLFPSIYALTIKYAHLIFPSVMPNSKLAIEVKEILSLIQVIITVFETN
jgi:hypothetical protein